MLDAVLGAEQIGLEIPTNNTSIMSCHMACLATSRGSFTLGSRDPTALPTIDLKYYATEIDRFVIREGWRVISKLMLQTPAGKDLVTDENAADIIIAGKKKLRRDLCSGPVYCTINSPKYFAPSAEKALGLSPIQLSCLSSHTTE